MKKKVKSLNREVIIPEGIKAEVANGSIKITGPEGEMSRKIVSKLLTVEIKDNKFLLAPKVKSTKREKCVINTTCAHIKNMMQGVTEPYTYKLKICSSHFPMSVKINNNELVVSNFIGEKIARKLKIKEGADVKIDGDFITVTSVNKELAGQIAGAIEKVTKRPNFDKRRFMDGIYITEKAGVALK